MDLVVWSQVCCRWFGYIPCIGELCCTCDHVHLLWDVSAGSSLPEVLVVEKVHDFHTTDPVCDGHFAHLPVLLHEGLPVPVPGLPLRHLFVWSHLYGPVSQFLVPRLRQRTAATESLSERQRIPKRAREGQTSLMLRTQFLAVPHNGILGFT